MMDSITERLKEQCICQAYDGPGKPACVECDAVAELDRLRRELAEAQRERDLYDTARSELRVIASVSTKDWDDPSDFRAWAQNRARYRLERIDAAMASP